MARIKCNAEKCSHNESGCCYADRVNIVGNSASSDKETCCGSYLNSLLYGNLTNCTTSSGSCDFLVCNVENCKYNENCLCNLESIQVSGNNPEIYTETRCESFEKRMS